MADNEFTLLNEDEYFKIVLNCLDFMSKSYEDQTGASPSFVDFPEERVSNFENALLLLPQLMDAQFFFSTPFQVLIDSLLSASVSLK